MYVDRIVQASEAKAIEVTKLAPSKDTQLQQANPAESSDKATKDWRHRIAKRAAREIGDGFYVNLGVGIPTLIPEVRYCAIRMEALRLPTTLQHLDPAIKVWLESENGILGMGPYPTKDQVDA